MVKRSAEQRDERSAEERDKKIAGRSVRIVRQNVKSCMRSDEERLEGGKCEKTGKQERAKDARDLLEIYQEKFILDAKETYSSIPTVFLGPHSACRPTYSLELYSECLMMPDSDLESTTVSRV
eukprot:1392914-Amorphochlora_amoeboformis.AAC.3